MSVKAHSGHVLSHVLGVCFESAIHCSSFDVRSLWLLCIPACAGALLQTRVSGDFGEIICVCVCLRCEIIMCACVQTRGITQMPSSCCRQHIVSSSSVEHGTGRAEALAQERERERESISVYIQLYT